MDKIQDILPITLFFTTYYFYDFFQATAALVIATAILLIKSYLMAPKKLSSYSSQLILIILGTTTLLTRNEMFLVWKPTVMYLVSAGSLLVSQLFYKKSLLEKGFSLANLHAPNYPWYKLDMILTCVFTALAIINLKVFYAFGVDFWIKYKLYSILAILILMIPVVLHIDSNARQHEPS